MLYQRRFDPSDYLPLHKTARGKDANNFHFARQIMRDHDRVRVFRWEALTGAEWARLRLSQDSLKLISRTTMDDIVIDKTGGNIHI